jgi:hypothetical protein
MLINNHYNSFERSRSENLLRRSSKFKDLSKRDSKENKCYNYCMSSTNPNLNDKILLSTQTRFLFN